jgi:hypothetical protein
VAKAKRCAISTSAKSRADRASLADSGKIAQA